MSTTSEKCDSNKKKMWDQTTDLSVMISGRSIKRITATVYQIDTSISQKKTEDNNLF